MDGGIRAKITRVYGFPIVHYLSFSLPMTRICVNFSTVYNDTLVVRGLNKDGQGSQATRLLILQISFKIFFSWSHSLFRKFCSAFRLRNVNSFLYALHSSLFSAYENFWDYLTDYLLFYLISIRVGSSTIFRTQLSSVLFVPRQHSSIIIILFLKTSLSSTLS